MPSCNKISVLYSVLIKQYIKKRLFKTITFTSKSNKNIELLLLKRNF